MDEASGIASILTSLFLVTPPTLTPLQISPNLSSRLRLLHLPPTPPFVDDLPSSSSQAPQQHHHHHHQQQPHHHHDFLPEDPSFHSSEPIPAEDGNSIHANDHAARLRFAEWMVTDLHPSASHVSTTQHVSHTFFQLREHLRFSNPPFDPADIVDRLVQRKSYAQADGHDLRVRLDLWPLASIASASPTEEVQALSMILLLQPQPSPSQRHASDPGTYNVTYENLLPTALIPQGSAWTADPPQPPQRGFLTATTTATGGDVRHGGEAPDQSAAEYISHADDFWAGFSDDDDDEANSLANRPKASVAALSRDAEDQESRYWASYNDDQASKAEQAVPLGSTLLPGQHDYPDPRAQGLQEENARLKDALAQVLHKVQATQQEVASGMMDEQGLTDSLAKRMHEVEALILQAL